MARPRRDWFEPLADVLRRLSSGDSTVLAFEGGDHKPAYLTNVLLRPQICSNLRRLLPSGYAPPSASVSPWKTRWPFAADRRLRPRLVFLRGCSTYRQVRLRGPTRPGRGPQRRPLRAPWVRIRGAATTAMSLHRRGAATKKTGSCRRNPSGRWGSWPISALLVVDDARASTSSSRLDLDSRAPSADGTAGPGPSLLVANTTSHSSFPASRRKLVRYAGWRRLRREIGPAGKCGDTCGKHCGKHVKAM
jgi:hypothetical protein